MVELIFDFSDFRAGWGVLDKLNVARDKGSDVMNYYMKCNAIGSQYKGTWSLFLPDLRLSHSWQCSLNVADVAIVVGWGIRVSPLVPLVSSFACKTPGDAVRRQCCVSVVCEMTFFSCVPLLIGSTLGFLFNLMDFCYHPWSLTNVRPCCPIRNRIQTACPNMQAEILAWFATMLKVNKFKFITQ